MATAALLNPAPQYHPQPGPFPSSSYPNYSHPTTSSSMSGIVSPVEPRRTSDDVEPPRQSLPSIREVISGTKPGPPSPYPSSASVAASGPPSLPSPFSASGPSRSFADPSPHDKQSSPRALHNSASYPSRSEPMPLFPDPARASLPGRPPPPPPPPMSTYPGIHPSPMKMDGHGHERPGDGHNLNGSFSRPSSEPSHIPYQQPTQLPPGQLPLSAHPLSPRYGGPSLPSPFDGSRSSIQDEAEFRRSGPKYEQAVRGHYEQWNYSESLAKLASGSRTLFNFADAYSKIAAEEQSPYPLPSRLPSEREVGEMLSMADWMRGMLENVQGLVQQSIANDRAREASRGKAPYDDDITMYDDSMKGAYDMGGVKKRRGRAAPPGRCHSCNRIDTPEWRRGPDGARTLCNACGLHYAKLERKKASDAKNIRPRPSDDRS